MSSGLTFRIFVSSTFSDFRVERNALQEHAFPKLRKLCLEHGCRFQAIDLRWGVSEESGLDQRTMRTCLAEIARCKRVTPRPNFIVLLGDRYGWRPLPEEIPSGEFELIAQCIDDPATADLLESWYRRDDNAAPPTYVLQSRSGPFASYEIWRSRVERPLRLAILRAIGRLALPAAALVKYTASATEQEVILGALSDAEAAQHVHCFFRTIHGLPEHGASEYADTGEHDSADHDARARLRALKSRLATALPGNIHTYEADWTGTGITEGHLPQLCDDVIECLSRVIHSAIDAAEALDPQVIEVQAHSNFASDRLSCFVGRDTALREIRRYVERMDRLPLAVWGPPGCGKSATMAKAASDAHSTWPDAVVVSRFIGATPSSCVGRELLSSLCVQVSKEYGTPLSALPSQYSELVSTFRVHLGTATAERPLMIFLDGLDQLSEEDGARSLVWLPEELPPHVKLVVSSSSSECLAALGARVPAGNLVPIGVMSLDRGAEILDRWLVQASRRLQSEQEAAVLRGFAECGLPLYLKLVFEEARLWRSYDPVRAVGSDIPDVLRIMFQRLSSPVSHGLPLVSHAFSYLCCAKRGLTEDEILDLLALDDDYFQTFLKHAQHALPQTTPGHRHLPVVVWSRLYADIQPLLVERPADGATVLAFCHEQFADTVTAEYLRGAAAVERHRIMARYFGSQVNAEPATRPTLASRRGVSELMHHQRLAEQWGDLQATTTDLGFLQAKAEFETFAATLAEVERSWAALSAVGARDSAPIGYLRGYMRRHAEFFAEFPSTFGSSVLSSAPATVVEKFTCDEVRPQVTVVVRDSSTTALQAPQHLERISSMDLSPEGSILATASYDGKVCLWQPASGEFLRSYAMPARAIFVAFVDEGRRLVCVPEYGSIEFRDTESGALLSSFGQLYHADRVMRLGVARVMVNSAVWNVFSGKMVGAVNAVEGDLPHVGSPDGAWGVSQHLRAWDLGTFKLVWDNGVVVDGLAFLDGSRFAAGGDPVTIWDVSTAKQVGTLPFSGAVHHLGGRAPEGLVQRGRSIHLVDFGTGERLWRAEARHHRILAAVGNPNAGIVAVSSAKGDSHGWHGALECFGWEKGALLWKTESWEPFVR